MKRLPRTIAALTLISLLTPGFSPLGHAQNTKADEKTFTIAGATGVWGAALRGLPGDIITDENGQYSAQIPYGWSGRITPTMAGFTFDPPVREYSPVMRDYKSENYMPKVMTFTISGNVGAPGVVMKGLPGDPVSDQSGVYSAKVEYGWSGAVTPMKEGYLFTPERRVYEPVAADSKDIYAAHIFSFTISGHVWTRTASGTVGVEGVILEGLPGEVVTDEKGWYEVAVEYGWTGRVTPRKEGYDFQPPLRDYSAVAAEQKDQDFDAGVNMIAPPGSAGEVLVIPTTAVALEKFGQTAEDMRVMLDILREKLNESRTVPGVLSDYGDFFRGTGRTVEALYVQGCGAIFVMRVDFPFSLPAPQDQAEAPPQEAVDPVWQRARQKLYQPSDPRRGAGARPGGAGEMDLNQFKDDLLRTLRHAANIRNIDPNEWVILTVISQSGGGAPTGVYGGGMGMGGIGGYGGMMSGYGSGGGMGGSGGMGGMMGGSGGGADPYGGAYSSSGSSSGTRVGRGRGQRVPAPPAGATVLTLQAKKADIDAFARGGTLASLEEIYGAQPGLQGQRPAKSNLSFEQFQQKVKVFTY